MGWSDIDVLCKRHPDHHQQPGVCSCCLVEKLNQLSHSPHPYNMIRTLVAVPSTSFSAASSTSMSPVHHHRHRHRRHASTGGGGSSFRFIISGGGGGLKKSRSIAIIATNHGGGLEEKNSNSKHSKGIGFWKKLIRSTRKGTKNVLLHSRTVKPTSHHQF